MISTKAAFVAAVAAGSALAVTACGGSSDKTSSEPAPSASAAASSAAPPAAPSAAATEAATDTTLPTGDELAKTVATLIIPTTTPAERAKDVIGGADLVPTLTKLDAYLKDFKVTFKVNGVAQTGKTVKGNVQIISNGKPFPKLYPAFWQQADAKWELTRSGACSLIAVSGITCPDAPAS